MEETKKSLIRSKVHWELQGQGKRASGQGQDTYKAKIRALQMNSFPQAEQYWMQAGTRERDLFLSYKSGKKITP